MYISIKLIETRTHTVRRMTTLLCEIHLMVHVRQLALLRILTDLISYLDNYRNTVLPSSTLLEC